MVGWWSLPELHAKLAAGLPGNKCSHRLCPPHALAPYAVRSTSCGEQCPIAGTVKTFNSARDVNSHFASDRMLAQSVRVGQSRLFALPLSMGYGV